MENHDKLMSQIEKRIKTTMIGALAKMENNFAFMNLDCKFFNCVIIIFPTY